jgi:GNAT superfamily N-acetyltransferase
VTRTQPLLRPATAADEQLLAGLLAGLSPASAFHRFMAGLGGAKPALVRALLAAHERRGAWLAVERDAAGTERAVGHASWSVDEAGVADLGVVVADEAQGRGVGRALFEAAGLSAAGAGATAVHLDVHPDNRRVARILRARLGARALTWDQGLLTVDTPLADAVRTLVAPPQVLAA